ncbi:glutathione S-transferase N-terminal domain-containing protein [Rhodovulum sp. DZ06]|uniref:glutathione S-transferase N-terminal domain-containing protein n=1 Tax=Rhodovulum sp. DZ06 TaxID=3425126 RepID=UPI003D3474F5
MTDLPRPARLYTVSTAPNPRRVLAAMALKGIEIPLVEMDMVVKKEQYAPDYIAKTGRPVIPALELETGEILTETVAITRYLDALVPEPPLFGRDPLEAARIEMWQRRAEFELLVPVAMVFRHGHPGMAELESQVGDWARVNLPRVEKGFQMLEDRLQASPFLGGDALSVADITAYMACDFAKVSKLRPSEDKTALAAWQAKLKAMPGFAMKKPG